MELDRQLHVDGQFVVFELARGALEGLSIAAAAGIELRDAA
jgi:hypothetical protein